VQFRRHLTQVRVNICALLKDSLEAIATLAVSSLSVRTWKSRSAPRRQYGKSTTVQARFVHNDRLVDALHMQAGAAVLHDPGARAYYDELRAREIGHNAALRQLGNRLVGILHGCLKPGTPYNPETAWSHRYQPIAA
jgi:hypothetical protein